MSTHNVRGTASGEYECSCGARWDRDEGSRCPATVAVSELLLPERSNERGSDGKLTYEAMAHNRCLDEVVRLNRKIGVKCLKPY